MNVSLSPQEYELLSGLIKDRAGIHLGPGKETLLRARLSKRLRALGLESFEQYIVLLRSDRAGPELTELLDAIATNVTSFFRQPAHFVHLRNEILQGLANRSQGRRIRIWSAACSTGEEPYSIGIQLREGIPNLNAWDAKILATDLSTKALADARAGTYEASTLVGFPEHYTKRYLSRVMQGTDRVSMRVNDCVRELITFGHLNLMEEWNVRGPFDVIFCRNVMIYFDKATQARLVGRFNKMLAPGGTLFIGHSESLGGIQDGYKCVGPAIYAKV